MAKNFVTHIPPLSLQEEFAPFGDDTGVVATEGRVEGLAEAIHG